MPELRLRPRPNAPVDASTSTRGRSTSPAPCDASSSTTTPSSNRKAKPKPKSVDTIKTKPRSPISSFPIPRSPFGAWTGSPRTPIMPSFARSVPFQVQLLLGLAVLLLLGALWATLTEGIDVGRWIHKTRDITTQSGKRTSYVERDGKDHTHAHEREHTPEHMHATPTSTLFRPLLPHNISLAVYDDLAFQDPGEKGHEAWVRMLPAGNGLVVVEQPRRHGLPRSERLVDYLGGAKAKNEGRKEDAEVFEVAVVRELECLLIIRDLLGEVFGAAADGRSGVQEWERREAGRCLDHLRQSILCHADLTLEKVGPGKHEPGSARKHGPNRSPGDHEMHLCRIWMPVLGPVGSVAIGER